MDILIKSFNRAYYLDRCITSIYQNVVGFSKIMIIDDGTPTKYLNKIVETYPEVILVKTKNYAEKSEKILKGEICNGIPSDDWIQSVEKCSDYFLMIEDDVWFTSEINLNVLEQEMVQNNCSLLKIAWQGNTKFNDKIHENKISDNIVSQRPNILFINNEVLLRAFFNNTLKIRSFLCRLGIANNQTINQYYFFISISMGIYHKKFWLYTWKESKGKVNEVDLMINASIWYKRNSKKKSNLICRTQSEYLKTTCQSSSTSDYHRYKNQLDVDLFNKTLNEAWFTNRLDSYQNYPKDFSFDYISSFLPLNKNCNKEIWNHWRNEFKNHFRNAGCSVD